MEKGQLKKQLLLMIISILSCLIVISTVKAECDICSCCFCRHTIKVIPKGAVETGDPIVTTSPASLTIFHTGSGPIKNVWLLIVINKQTYDNLNRITINGSIFLTKNDFQLVTEKEIPPLLSNSTTGYPGSICNYSTTAIKDKMDEKGKPVYYSIKFFLPQITKIPKEFNLTVETTSPTNVKAIVLALGKYDPSFQDCIPPSCFCSEQLNTCSSLSKSTFVIPEPATITLTTAFFLAIMGFYFTKRREE